MTLDDVLRFLTTNPSAAAPYMVRQKDKYLLTAAFYQATTGEDIGIDIASRKDIIVKERVVKRPKTVVVKGGVEVPVDGIDWVELYQSFIIEADIPQFGYLTSGTRYELRRATKPGRLAFKAALEEGAEYDKLLLAVRSYYSTNITHKKIENYFIEEMWRSDYGVATPDNNDDSSLGF